MRITPACAGRSTVAPTHSCPAGDHPRVRGEKRTSPVPCAGSMGSPPRARGEADLLHLLFNCTGITPACAGRRGWKMKTKRPRRDHPRVRGEKSTVEFVSSKDSGSPPRARGEARTFSAASARLGITPACAGRRLKKSHTDGLFRFRLRAFHSVWHIAVRSSHSRFAPDEARPEVN